MEQDASGRKTRIYEVPVTPSYNKFPPGVAEELHFYVYRLIDPRNGETFYVGKGKGDRIFAHARAEIAADEAGAKLKRIHDIRLAGFDVAHVIHRHGMDEKTAFEVEAALIDAYPGLAVEVSGHGSGDRGTMHVREIVERYCAPEAEFTGSEKVLLINVNRESAERSLYEAVRFAWKIDPRKASRADVVLATVRGVIRGAFIAQKWLPANAQNFPDRWIDGDTSNARHGFLGHEASLDVQGRYVGKRVPERFRKRGASNPIKYAW
jgi:uncharacterized protein